MVHSLVCRKCSLFILFLEPVFTNLMGLNWADLIQAQYVQISCKVSDMNTLVDSL